MNDQNTDIYDPEFVADLLTAALRAIEDGVLSALSVLSHYGGINASRV